MHAVIVAVKAPYRDLKIAHFPRVAWSFVYKIRTELEKENDKEMSVLKSKKKKKESKNNILHVMI